MMRAVTVMILAKMRRVRKGNEAEQARTYHERRAPAPSPPSAELHLAQWPPLSQPSLPEPPARQPNRQPRNLRDRISTQKAPTETKHIETDLV